MLIAAATAIADADSPEELNARRQLHRADRLRRHRAPAVAAAVREVAQREPVAD